MSVHFFYSDLNEASLLWNLKIRYDKELIYVSELMVYVVNNILWYQFYRKNKLNCTHS